MNLIAAVDKNWAIGKGGQLLVRIPMDMKLFRQTTIGKVVVMGRKTLESFPGGMPLKDRVNIVLTRNPRFEKKGAVIMHSVEELKQELTKYKSDDVYVIGGAKIYEQLVDDCERAYITRIDYAYDADAWFPDLDTREGWVFEGESEEQTYFDLEFRFCRYRRVREDE